MLFNWKDLRIWALLSLCALQLLLLYTLLDWGKCSVAWFLLPDFYCATGAWCMVLAWVLSYWSSLAFSVTRHIHSLQFISGIGRMYSGVLLLDVPGALLGRIYWYMHACWGKWVLFTDFCYASTGAWCWLVESIDLVCFAAFLTMLFSLHARTHARTQFSFALLS